MNNFRIMVLVLVAGVEISGAWAQEPSVLFPKGPAAWSVEIKGLPDPEKRSEPIGGEKMAKIVRIEVAQDGQKFRQIVKMSNGKTRESWGVEGLSQTLTEDPNGTVYFSVESEPFDLSAFNWVGPDTLQEKTPVPFLGRSCFHYKTEKKVMENGVLQGILKLETWIDDTTKLPVAFQTNLDQAVYNFQEPAPRGLLPVPERFAILIANKRRAMGLP